MTEALSVSIVLYRTPPRQVVSCLESLRRYAGSMTVWLVDNSPTDELRNISVQGVRAIYIHQPSNPGYGAGHNVAIRQAALEGFGYHLVINADVTFHSDILSPMLAHMDANPRVGQMMPKILNPDGSVQRLCKLVPSPGDLFLRALGRRNAASAKNRRYELHDTGYDRMMFVPYLSGCFMLLRHDALREIGLFDPAFFMYPEDIDLTRRMAEKYDTIYFPYVCATHEHGGASRKSVKMFIVHATNIVRYFNKWGWFVDPARDRLNRRALAQFHHRTQP